MGYTHYWRRQRSFTPPEWSQITAAFRKVLAADEVSLAGGDGTGEPLVTGDEVIFNGREPDDAHEAMWVTREMAKSADDEDHNGDFTFCKTARKPYDAAVCALLIFVENFAPAAITVSSDGDTDDPEWQLGLKLARSATNMPDLQFPRALGGAIPMPEEAGSPKSKSRRRDPSP